MGPLHILVHHPAVQLRWDLFYNQPGDTVAGVSETDDHLFLFSHFFLRALQYRPCLRQPRERTALEPQVWAGAYHYGYSGSVSNLK